MWAYTEIYVFLSFRMRPLDAEPQGCTTHASFMETLHSIKNNVLLSANVLYLRTIESVILEVHLNGLEYLSQFVEE
jgi:hypothetical protein